MTFTQLAAGDAVFVEAHMRTYQFQPLGGLACTQLLQQIENLQLGGSTTSHVIGELCHRLMTLEAHTALGWPIAGIAHLPYGG